MSVKFKNLGKFTLGIFCEAWHCAKKSTGRMFRQAGLELDRSGSQKMNDIAFLQSLNRHRNLVYMEDCVVGISQSAYLAPNATVFGNVFIAKDSYVGFGAVVDGVYNSVRIGENTKIGDATTVQCAQWVPDEAFPISTSIGNHVNIEHSCNIFGSIIDDHTHIGFRTVVMEGAQLERGCVIAPNSYVTAGSRIPENTLWAGNPAQFVKNLDPIEKRLENDQSDSNVKLSIE